jgi:ureidoacrylate peracid hydrolase
MMSPQSQSTALPSGFDPKSTALLVIDPVNDFLSEDGAGWEMTKSTVKKNDVVASLRRLIAGAREAGVPVLFGPMAYTEEDYSDGGLQRRSGINRLMFEHKMFLAGSWGADFHPDLQPTGDDVILEPHKGTDVFETDLPRHLERLSTEQLVIAGMTANLCCESTGRHATEHGYHVTFLSDAIGAESLPAYEASIHVNYPLIANAVMEVDEFLAAISAATQNGQEPQVGDTVIGSDRGKIGEVVEVVQGQGEILGHLRVPRGIVSDKDTYIPIDAVTHRSDGRVYVNIPKLVVGKMPWSEPPSTTHQDEKRGPASAEVAQLYRSHHPTGVGP